MNKKSIHGHRYIEHGPDIPPSRAGISHGVVSQQTCHIGGQLSVDRNGNYQPGTIAQETRQSFRNLFAVLKSAGFAEHDLVFLELAFQDLNDLKKVSAIYNDLFPEHARPCRTVHEVQRLPYDAKIRIHGIAMKNPKPDSLSG